jgi:hypothetical protein
MALLKRDRIPLALGALVAAALTVAAAVASVANAAPQGNADLVTQTAPASEGSTSSSAR